MESAQPPNHSQSQTFMSKFAGLLLLGIAVLLAFPNSGLSMQSGSSSCQMTVHEDTSPGGILNGVCHTPQNCNSPAGTPACQQYLLQEGGLHVYYCDCTSDGASSSEPECCHLVAIYDPENVTWDWDIRGTCRPAIVDCPDGGDCTHSTQEFGSLHTHSAECAILAPGE